jgi:peptidoglycan hydrolase CwlO-like protein
VRKLSCLLLVVYLVTGVLVALAHNYFDNIDSQRQLISTLLNHVVATGVSGVEIFDLEADQRNVSLLVSGRPRCGMAPSPPFSQRQGRASAWPRCVKQRTLPKAPAERLARPGMEMSPGEFITIRGRGLAAAAGLVAMSVVPALAPTDVGAQTAKDTLDDARADEEATKHDLEALLTRYRGVRARVRDLWSQLTETERHLRTLAQRVIEQKMAAKRLALELYKSGGTVDLEGLLSSESIADVNESISYLGYAQKSRAETFERLAVISKQFRSRLRDLEREYAETNSALAELDAIKARVEAELLRRRARVERLEDEVARRRAERAIKDVEVVQASIERQAPVEEPASPLVHWHADWDAIAECESGGRWHLDADYDGGLQFHPETWLAYGGGKYAPHAWGASRLQQIAVAEKVLTAEGPVAWRNCFVPL